MQINLLPNGAKGAPNEYGHYDGRLHGIGTARMSGREGRCSAVRQHAGRLRNLEARVRRGGEDERHRRQRRRRPDANALRGRDHRSQRSFGLSLDQFLAKRGASTIVARGRSLKQSHAALFASIQQRYGVPPGPLIAIWGMETGFGSQRGNQNMLSSIATLAYDCRRPEFFAEQLYAALKLIDRGALSAGTRGSMHGEVGQTQFMPKNILAYGTGNLDVAANALNSTANFLRSHGWRAGAGYQPGEANFAAIEAWNAAPVYQKAIAMMGRQIDGEGASAAH